MNPEIQQLLARKAKADSLPPEIRYKYIDEYNQVVNQIVKYGLNYSIPTWDYDINSEILSIVLHEIAQKYEHKKPYVEWMCQGLVPEIDESFRTHDQARFHKCIQTARQQIRNV